MRLAVASAHVVDKHFIDSIFKSTASRCFFVYGGQVLPNKYDQCLLRIIFGMCLWALSLNLLPTNYEQQIIQLYHRNCRQYATG